MIFTLIYVIEVENLKEIDMTINRRANAVMFGFDFQVSAAIVLMLDNIKELQSIKIEGDSEDIELFLNNDEHILAQAKAVQNSSNDFRNVRQNLKKALQTLSEAYNKYKSSNKTNIRKVIFITNSPNPFKDDNSRSAFYGYSRRSFKDIPQSAQKIIKTYLREISNPLDLNKFAIYVLPFETDDEQERYKEVKRSIDDFIGDLNIQDYPGLGKQLMPIWLNNLFQNGTKDNNTIRLKKEDIVWPIIVLVTDISNKENMLEDLDDGLQEEIKQQYHQLIDSMCERLEFFTRILSDFQTFKNNKNETNIVQGFINHSWRSYLQYLDKTELNLEVKSILIKLILSNVIHRRFRIDKIKKGAGL